MPKDREPRRLTREIDSRLTGIVHLRNIHDVVPVLPPNLTSTLRELAVQGPIRQIHGGESFTLEKPGVEIEYRIRRGDKVPQELIELYQTSFYTLALETSKKKLVLADTNADSLTLNATQSGGMDLHRDTNPWAVNWYVEVPEEEGGGLLFMINGEEVPFYPKTGDVTSFDGQTYPHRVVPTNISRIVVAMNYYEESSERRSPPQALAQFFT